MSDPHQTTTKSNQKKIPSRAFSNGDDDMRSTTLSLVTDSNSSYLTSILNMKSKSLGPNDAYLISKRIKVNQFLN